MYGTLALILVKADLDEFVRFGPVRQPLPFVFIRDFLYNYLNNIGDTLSGATPPIRFCRPSLLGEGVPVLKGRIFGKVKEGVIVAFRLHHGPKAGGNS